MASTAVPSRNTPRDAFLYLAVVITLAMVSISLGSLLFDLVNIWLPDALMYGNRCGSDNCAAAVRVAMAFLIVSLPVLFFVWRFLQRDVAAHPEMLQSRIRRWLLYFTLFVAGGSLIGDFISLVINFLNGLMTLQFFIKTIIFAWIAGTVFYYFLNELKGMNGTAKRFVGWFAIAVAVAAIIAGFAATGLPTSARAQEADNQRVYALQNLQSQVVNYWQRKEQLPITQNDLVDPLQGDMIPVDPITGEPFEYTVTGPLSFRLCATFATEFMETTPRYYEVINDNWQHGKGLVCFERTIDPDLYKPYQVVP